VDTSEALSVLGISPGATADDVRTAYLRLIRDRHPDRALSDPDATHQTARLTQAYAVVRAVMAETGGATVPVPGRPAPASASAGSGPPDERARTHWPFDVDAEPVGAELVDSDTIAIEAPADEAFALLFEAAGRVGHVAYFDRHLGILETIVRFEGGPTCSVLITLQGHAQATEAFCTMESIEAAPTPLIRPVVEAIVDELTDPGPSSG
jgi:hypothetical protein